MKKKLEEAGGERPKLSKQTSEVLEGPVVLPEGQSKGVVAVDGKRLSI